MEHYPNSLVRLDRHPSRSSLRGFGIALTVLCLVRAGFAWSASHSVGQPACLAALGLIAAATAGLRPTLLRAPYVAFNTLTYPVRWLAAFSILALLYFAVITPVAWLFRLTRGTPQHVGSAWRAAKPRGDKSDYFRQF